MITVDGNSYSERVTLEVRRLHAKTVYVSVGPLLPDAAPRERSPLLEPLLDPSYWTGSNPPV
jgi:hypothetical protein